MQVSLRDKRRQAKAQWTDPQLHDHVEVFTVRNDGFHNGFPGMCLWKGRYFIAFRTAYEHNPAFPRGYITVLSTDNPHAWDTATEVRIHSGGDDRDPFFIPSDDQLLLLFGSYSTIETEFRTGHTQIRPMVLGSHSCSLAAPDGLWSWPIQAYRLGYWPWSGLHVEETFDSQAHYLGAAYHAGDQGDNCTLTLIRSMTGRKWFNQGQIRDELNVSLTEPVLFWKPNSKTIYCLARREGLGYGGFYEDEMYAPVLGCLDYAHTTIAWKDWTYLDLPIHPSAVVHTPLGFVMGGRTEVQSAKSSRRTQSRRNPYDEKSRALEVLAKHETTLHTLDIHSGDTKKLLTLPSYGDCGYPSMLYDTGKKQLLVAYYSQHEYQGEISLARTPIPAGIYLAIIGLEHI